MPKKKDALVYVLDRALPDALVTRARRAIARIGRERIRESYFTSFWFPRGAKPANAVEEMVTALWQLSGERCAGVEWWIGRSYTTQVPIDFHYDSDVKGSVRRHPQRSSTFFFNTVRGGQLAVTDGKLGRDVTRLESVKPRRNRYALFAGDVLHGVLDARGKTPLRRRLPGPRGRLRVTLILNFWDRRPTKVPTWSKSGIYRALR